MLICQYLPFFRDSEGGGLSQPRPRARLDQIPTFRQWAGALAAQPQLLDESAIALEVVLLHVREEAAPPSDELQQPAPRVVILRVGAQMLGEIVDALRQHRDLHLRRPRIGVRPPVLLDQLLLDFLRESHVHPPVRRLRTPRAAGRKTRPAERGSAAIVASMRDRGPS